MNNPKAFPCYVTYQKDKTKVIEFNTGMDLRDYFASRAMQGLVADINITLIDVKEISKYAYSMADAMLKAREVQ